MSVRVKAKLKSVYGKPLSKMIGQTITPKPEHLKKAAKIILEAVRKEITRDVGKSNSLNRAAGNPIPLPNTIEFAKSFSARVIGSQIEIISNWPFASLHTEGREPYKMTWLTQAEGVKVVPIITRDGITLIRDAPLTRGEAWIHPGFIKYTFLERGIKKGREAVAEMLAREVLIPMIMASDLLL